MKFEPLPERARRIVVEDEDIYECYLSMILDMHDMLCWVTETHGQPQILGLTAHGVDSSPLEFTAVLGHKASDHAAFNGMSAILANRQAFDKLWDESQAVVEAAKRILPEDRTRANMDEVIPRINDLIAPVRQAATEFLDGLLLEYETLRVLRIALVAPADVPKSVAELAQQGTPSRT